MHYLKRVSEQTLMRYLKAFPVVGVTGPRQSGKSTLLQHTLTSYEYVTFDDPTTALSFDQDPEGFMARYKHHVIFDEVQYVPDIFRYIKLAVDNDRQAYGKFVLTGSAQFSMIKNITESLAGRIGLMTVLPFQMCEIPQEYRYESLYRGSYPELIQRHYRESGLWYSAYLDTYLNKDVRNLAHIGDLRDFQRLVTLLASNVATSLNLSTYAKALGLSVPTIKRWISLLEASYVIFLLPPYHENFGKRLIKSPKIYFYDSGLVAYLTGITNAELYEKGPMAGQLFENYLISDILKKERHNQTQAQLYHMRTHSGEEIHLIIHRKTHKEWIEIKKSATFRPKMIETVKKYKRETDKGFLLYTGKKKLSISGIQVVHYSKYLHTGDSSAPSEECD